MKMNNIVSKASGAQPQVEEFFIGPFKFVMMVLVASIFVACQSSQFQNEDQVVGVWEVAGDYVEFSPDGTYNFALTYDSLSTTGIEFGEYKLEEGRLHFITGEKSSVCSSQIGIYLARRVQSRNIELTLVEDECDIRAEMTDGSILTPYNP